MNGIAARLRLGVCAVVVSLFALVVRWVVIAPSTPRAVVGAILGLPLVVGLPFLYSGRRRSYAWMTLALAPSLLLGLTEAVANPAMRKWAALVLFAVIAAFGLLVAYLRATRSSSRPSQTAP
ncbi:MAG TPA: DUF2069 domain-containing protein [Steroidobacteraceae bacterium]|nr:DUF2069 domain-containing protein [Steroidobacteraceae bacterium]